jgi:membrane protein required for colicin V production
VNWLDILFLIILVASVLEGLKQGLARTGLGLVAFIVGLFCALWFYGAAAAYLKPHLSDRAANIVGFLVIFIGIVVLGGLLGALIAKLLKVVHLSWLDRLLGGAFGVVRGALSCAVIVLLIMAFSATQPPRPVANSRIAPFVIGTARVIVYAAPHEFSEAFHQSYDKVIQFWKDVTKKKAEHPGVTDL